MTLKDYCIKEGKEYLLEEWDDLKNLPFTPETVSIGSTIPVWWKCEKGHSWQTQVRSRSKTLTRCPNCLEVELKKSEKKRQRYLQNELNPNKLFKLNFMM